MQQIWTTHSKEGEEMVQDASRCKQPEQLLIAFETSPSIINEFGGSRKRAVVSLTHSCQLNPICSPDNIKGFSLSADRLYVWKWPVLCELH